MIGPSEIYSAIGRAVRMAREEAGITQDELGRRIGLKRTSITNLEAGRQQIQVHSLYAIAEALHVPVVALLPPQSVHDPSVLEKDLMPELPAGERDWVLRVLNGSE